MNSEKRFRTMPLAATLAMSLTLAMFIAPVPSQAQAPATGAAPAAAPPPAPFPPAILPGQTAKQHFENIRILKNIPADQLVPTMTYIATSLGVGCTYCHVAGSFQKDDKKPKVTARTMMTMVMKINKDSFDKKHTVECFTCHRGSPIPISIPPVPELGGKPPVALAGERVPGEPG